MAHHNLDEAAMSESIEMYLLRVAMLQDNGQPVPVPQLAHELAISPVSAHEMCRKLTDRGLVQYEPYKGVTLTTQGDALAQRVLRSRELWKTFFVDKLNLAPVEADEIACRFEHVTPEEVADRLAMFLHASEAEAGSNAVCALPNLATGARAQVVDFEADDVSKEFLIRQGVVAGHVLEIMAAGADGSRLVCVAGQSLSLAWNLAKKIRVIPVAVEPTSLLEEIRCD